jgi:putative intracellular protease/amidase
LAEDRASIDLIEVMWFEEKFVAAVCHGPGVFRHTKKPDGTPLVKAKSITGFANTEEEAVGLTHVVPFPVEEMLRANGGLFSKAENWHPHVVIDGNLVTGQNPASSEPAAKTLLHLMTRQQLSLMPGGAEPEPPFTTPP